MYKHLVLSSNSSKISTNKMYKHLTSSQRSIKRKLNEKISKAKTLCVPNNEPTKYSDTCHLLWDEIEELSAASNDLQERMKQLKEKQYDFSTFDPDDYH